ncbi:MAG: hypothetical protein FWG67_00405 [Defluviitaleaceae bacterium]|nr:hypothetical protein [Defluviitaleaceae bacterium]
MSNLSKVQREILATACFYPGTGKTRVGVYLSMGKRETGYHIIDSVQKSLKLYQSFKMKLRRKGETVRRCYTSEPPPILMRFTL